MLYLFMAALVCFMVTAQVVIKQRINLQAGHQQTQEAIANLTLDPWVWFAGALVIAAGFCWVLILRRTTLNYAYPFVAMTFVLTPLASHFALGEALRWSQVAGAVIILIGVSLAMMGGDQ